MRAPAIAPAAAAALVTLARATAALAGGDDADLIPQDVLQATPEAPRAPSSWRNKVFAEDALSAWSPAEAVPVPYPSTPVVRWQNRTSVDASLQWKPRPWLTLALSDRVDVVEQDGLALVSANTVRNALREVSAAWEPTQGAYLEAGRINVRNGAALGYNPTDFFKTRTLVGQSSLDPSAIRQNRLGTLMVRAQALGPWGSASVAYAPRVATPAPVTETKPVGIDPHFDTTNAAHRLLATLSFDLFDLSPQLLGYFELHRSKVGANVTRPIGDAVVAYAEWAAGPEQDLIARASAFGRDTGTLPSTVPTLPPTSTATSLRNDVAAGFSWTVATAVTFNVEYHFHEAGLTRRDWANWFDLGSRPGADPRSTAALWYVRGYANDQQEPLSQHQMFVRADWPRALSPDLELGAFAFVDLLDASVLTQLSASYYLTDAWTASAYLSADLGGGRTERGSVPQRENVILQLTRYL